MRLPFDITVSLLKGLKQLISKHVFFILLGVSIFKAFCVATFEKVTHVCEALGVSLQTFEQGGSAPSITLLYTTLTEKSIPFIHMVWKKGIPS